MQDHLEAEMIFFAHNLEEGLRHAELRHQFSANALRNLALPVAELDPKAPFDPNNSGG